MSESFKEFMAELTTAHEAEVAELRKEVFEYSRCLQQMDDEAVERRERAEAAEAKVRIYPPDGDGGAP